MPRPRKRPGELGRVTVTLEAGRHRAWVMVRDGAGRPHALSGVGSTSAEAVADVTRKAHALWAGMFSDLGADSTVKDLSVLWLEQLRKRVDTGKIKQTTVEGYQHALATIILPRIAAIPISALDEGFCARWLDALADERQSYPRKAKTVLTQMLAIAVKHGAVKTNAMKLTDGIEHSDPAYIELDPDQVDLVFRLIGEWQGRLPDGVGGVPRNWQLLRDALRIALGTSIRPSEVLALCRDDVRLVPEGMQLRIDGNVTYTKAFGNRLNSSPKRERQKRCLPVPPFAAEVIRRRLGDYVDNPDGLLFVTKNGTPYQASYLQKLVRAFRTQYREELERAGIDVELFTLKAMRKTAATVTAERGGAQLAAELLGHADKQTTRRHYIKDKIQEVDWRSAEILERRFGALR